MAKGLHLPDSEIRKLKRVLSDLNNDITAKSRDVVVETSMNIVNDAERELEKKPKRIDLNDLRGSIHAKVNHLYAEVLTEKKYAVHVHWGTGSQWAT